MRILDDELLHEDLVTLARRLENKTLSAQELTQRHLDAIRKHDPAINSFISLDENAALSAAAASDQRRAKGQSLSTLDGLTVAIKDNIDVEGFVTTNGLNINDAQKASRDAFCVAKLRAAGAIVLGKLNLQEGALGATNHNPHHGDCHNPRRHGYTPGGSSGGSAAAVAAGFTAFSLGSDTMGSVRIPAAYCGVAGIKPSYGLVSIDGAVKVSCRLDHIGPIARSPRDLAVVLQYMQGFDAACPQSRRVVLRPDTDPQTASAAPDIKRRCRIPANLDFAGIESRVATAFSIACEILRREGVFLSEMTIPEYDYGAVRRAGLLVCEAEMCVENQQLLRDSADVFSDTLRSLLAYPTRKSALDFAVADRRMDDATIFCEHLLEGVDYMLLPTTPQTAFSLSDEIPAGQADLTAMANMSGYPALSFYAGDADNGLPVGMQILGRPGDDFDMIRLAQSFFEVLHDNAS